jgi:linoleoyl-CoA desaturase
MRPVELTRPTPGPGQSARLRQGHLAVGAALLGAVTTVAPTTTAKRSRPDQPGRRLASAPRRGGRAAPGPQGGWEPWRDWAAIAVLTHGLLLFAALTQPSLPVLLALTVPLGVILSTGTLTVLHDAGHRRLSHRRGWLNVLAVQTAVPVGLWVGHWTLKHRVHHRATAVYPVDDATHASALIRLHPAVPRRAIHRYQHLYAWPLYGLAWLGELQSQLSYLWTGRIDGTRTPGRGRRAASFAAEKTMCVAVLAPYAVLLGLGRLTLLLLAAMTIAGVLAAVVLVVGHINVGLVPSTQVPAGREWAAHLVRTTASFSTGSRAVRWLTGGMTHHLAHHLRPAAARHQLPMIHVRTAAALADEAAEPLRDFPTLRAAVRGHGARLRELGRSDRPSPIGAPAMRSDHLAVHRDPRGG